MKVTPFRFLLAILPRFFESRKAPADAPLVLWLNGGPGCSSSTGLLFELGPCSIANNGHNTTYNPHSWNSDANIIFLDQPVNVGFSYADDGTTVSTSPVAGKDVYAFLELFLNRYPKYANAPFHIAAESYGGTYAPNFASVIFKANHELSLAPNPKIKHINLSSIILANGLTDPYIQMGSVPDYVCDGPYPVYDDPKGAQCEALRTKVPTCQRLVKSCYNFNSKFTCVPAMAYCNSQLFGPLMRRLNLVFNTLSWAHDILETGLNPYDVRRKCDRSEDKDGQLCYKQMGWIETWMNEPSNKAALGVNPEKTFESCNMAVNQAFALNGDGMHNSAALLPELVDGGVRLLVYAGNAGEPHSLCVHHPLLCCGNSRSASWNTRLSRNPLLSLLVPSCMAGWPLWRPMIVSRRCLALSNLYARPPSSSGSTSVKGRPRSPATVVTRPFQA